MSDKTYSIGYTLSYEYLTINLLECSNDGMPDNIAGEARICLTELKAALDRAQRL